MLVDIFFFYIAEGICCGLICGFPEYMALKNNHKLERDDWVTVLVIFTMAFILWPLLIIMTIVWDIGDKFTKKK